MTDVEHAQLRAWNETTRPLDDARPVHERFEAQAARSPDRIAIEIDGARLTYAELDARANDLAHVLQERGVGPDVLVAVCMERSLELLVSVYAVLKAGGAYAPLDPTLPAARLAFMTRDLQARAVLFGRGAALTFELGDAALIEVDARSPVLRPSKPTTTITDAQLAYVIYTSGSTGTPKAAMNTHGGLRNRLAWMQGAYPLGERDCVLQKTPFTFDVSVWELFWPLAEGARLVLARPEGHKDPLYLAEIIRSAKVTTIHFVPSMLQLFLDEPSATEGSPLVRVICSGEALPRALVTRFHERFDCELHNLYGPTEASIDVTAWPCARGESGDVPIGRPIWNTQIHIVDALGRPCPIGVAGEIWIGGLGVGRGYWQRPELTAEKFVPDTFSGAGTVYRTGDLGRYRSDGAVVYLGRLDHQVKIRGFRIELGEIEATIAAQPTVREVVVIAREDVPGDKRLVGYVVGASGGDVDVAQIRSALRAALPDYMVPSALLVVPSLPLTASGKVDRKALPAPDFAAAAVAYVVPETPTERILAELWADLLRVPRVSRNDDFFALGGDSLHAARLAARMRSLLGVVPPRTIFEAPTLAALAAQIDRARAEGRTTAEAPIARAPRGARLPLSYMQERLWFLEQFEPGSAAYLLPSAVRLTGPLRADLLEQAFAQVLTRHEALRTGFADDAGTPYAVVKEPAPAWERVDLSAVAPAERERQVARQVAIESTRPFDMKDGPLLRAKLLVLGPEEHVLLSTMHHIASDGWSLGVLAREIESLYATLGAEAPSALAELPIQYADFAVWQRQMFGETAVQQQLAYWKKQLAGAPAALELPTDRKRPPAQRHRGARITSLVGAETVASLEEIARTKGATMYMALLAAFGAVLGRLAGQRDVVVATPVVTRARPETDALVGFFMNTLAMRVDLDGAPTFEALLARVKETTLEAFANQEVPFDKVVVELNPTRDTSRNPIAQVSLNLLNLPSMRIALPGVTATPIDGTSTGSKFDLTLYVASAGGGGLSLELVYDRDLFERGRMERVLQIFEQVLAAFAARPTASIDDVSLVLDQDRAALPDPTAPLAVVDAPSLLDLFEAHALRDGDQPCASDPRRRWTYAELRDRSHRLASWLTARSIGPGHVVAIHAERSALTLWALLGVLECGAAFTLLDAHYPPSRLVEQLRITKPSAWIGAAETTPPNGELAEAVAAIGQRLDLATAGRDLDALPATFAPVAWPADRRAYVVFTSGTTGGPKAIEGGLLALSHFSAWQAKTFELGAADRFSVLSGLAHDPFLRDVLTPLSIGASIHFPSDELRLEPDRLAAWLVEHRITVSHLTPSLGEVVSLARGVALRDLRCAFFGGEPLRGELVQSLRKLAPKARFVNFYGATETPQAMASFVIDKPLQGIAPIGRGIDGVQLLVLDARGALAGVDEEGEICVRTPYLAFGYLDGTKGGFGQSPFTGDPADRVYRTGDRGRYLADGNVQSSGRRDSQVKIRGFRVELGEVELALRACDGVRQATAIVREDTRALVGYVTGDVDPVAITRTLRKRLPDYMVPVAMVRLESIPLTPNGKVDVRSLPAPSAAPSKQSEADLPANDIERSVAAIWMEVLGTSGLKRHDNFFDVGGHSLNATRVVARLRDTFDVQIPVRTIFEAPTVAELAALLATESRSPAGPQLERVATRDRGPLSGNQLLWWRRQELHPDLPRMNFIMAYRITGPLDEAALAASADEVFRRHDMLRTTISVIGDAPTQVVARARAGVLEAVDLRGRPATACAELQAALHAHLEPPGMVGPPQLTLARLADEEHRLILRFHRALLDPGLAGLVVSEALARYAARVAGEPSPLSEPRFQYLDYVAWQRKISATAAGRALLEGARRRIAEARPAPLPFDHPAPAAQTVKGRAIEQPLDDASWDVIASLAREAGSTQFVVLGAIYRAFLAQLTGERRIMVIAPNAMASGQDDTLSSMLGCFFNYFVTVSEVEQAATLRTVILREHAVMLDAYREVTVPAAVLVDPLDDSALCRAAINYHADEDGGLVSPPGLQVTRLPVIPLHRIADLAWVMFGRSGFLYFSHEKFDGPTAERIGADFAAFLRAALAAPDAPLADHYPRVTAS